MTDEPKKEDEVKEEVVEQDPTPSEGQSQETPQPGKQDSPTPEVKPEVDPEAITEQATQRAEERVMGRIASALGLTKDEQDQAKDEGLVPPWEKEGRNPKSYKEVAEYSADLAEWKRQQSEKKVEEDKKLQEEQKKKTQEQWNTHWDSQISDLEAAGKLPKVLDEKNPEDPGKKARKALWTKMYEINQERVVRGQPIITSLKEIYYEHYEDPNAQPAGADAPVSMGSRAVSNGQKTDYTYDDIHGPSFDQIIRDK